MSQKGALNTIFGSEVRHIACLRFPDAVLNEGGVPEGAGRA
jgi:hypothetical protein